MIPVWIRAAFSIGWLIVVAGLLWRTIVLSNMLVTLVTVLIVAFILMLSGPTVANVSQAATYVRG